MSETCIGTTLFAAQDASAGQLGSFASFEFQDVTRALLADDDSVQRIVVVDDEELNIRVARKYLRSWGYEAVEAITDPAVALKRLKCDEPDLVLLDVMMPGISGLEVLEALKNHAQTRHLPVIILTAAVDDQIKYRALELGANDFLAKPIDPLEMLPRVRNLLALRAQQKSLVRASERLEIEVWRRTAALVEAEYHVVDCLARAAEYRDCDTGKHVLRVGQYAALIARAIGQSDAYVKLIAQAAKLHDVGKIGIPDAVLLKTGRLDPDELKIMQQHAGMGRQVIQDLVDADYQSYHRHSQLGASILGAASSPLLKMAAEIAMTHHEKWDGSGYPLCLAGEQIPLCGRITAVADVFDALSSPRPYKPAFPLEKCCDILREGRGKHFQTELVDAFLDNREAAVAIQVQQADTI